MTPEVSIAWTDLPETLQSELGDPAVVLPELVRRESAVLVKNNSQRTIYRAHLLGQDLHIKNCRVIGWRAWFRGWLRPAKAMLEYRRLLRAFERGVPVVAPLGCGVARSLQPGPSFLVTRTVGGAVTLGEWLESSEALAAHRRVVLAKSLGRFLAKVHDAGFRHPDLHPGNILIRWTGEFPDLFLLDLHDVRIGSLATARQSLTNLAMFNRWFTLRANRTDRLRFWTAYVAQRGCNADYLAARDLEQRTQRSNMRLWRSRTARCLGTNRRFQLIGGARVAGHAVSDWRPAELESMVRDASNLLAVGSLLKDSPSSTVALRTIVIAGKPRQVIVKRFPVRSFKESLQSLFRADACHRSWVNGHAFIDCLLPTARPLAMFHRLHGGLPRERFLITDFIPGAIDLRCALLDASPPSPMERTRRRERIDRVARLIRTLHERGWSHRDLKAVNILLAPDGNGSEQAWFIDLVGAARPTRLTQSRRVKDIARLNASFHELPTLSRTDRLRFLRTYLGWNLHGRDDWKSWWRWIASRTLRKVQQNRRRGRPLA